MSSCSGTWYFFADVVVHVDNLNLKLQGENNMIRDLFSQIKVLRGNFGMCCEEVNKKKLVHNFQPYLQQMS